VRVPICVVETSAPQRNSFNCLLTAKVQGRRDGLGYRNKERKDMLERLLQCITCEDFMAVREMVVDKRNLSYLIALGLWQGCWSNMALLLVPTAHKLYAQPCLF
jgi:hypothetical protein